MKDKEESECRFESSLHFIILVLWLVFLETLPCLFDLSYSLVPYFFVVRLMMARLSLCKGRYGQITFENFFSDLCTFDFFFNITITASSAVSSVSLLFSTDEKCEVAYVLQALNVCCLFGNKI